MHIKRLSRARLQWFSSSALATNCRLNQSQKEAALVEIEHRRAPALDHHHIEAVGCILGQESQDAALEGKLRKHRPEFRIDIRAPIVSLNLSLICGRARLLDPQRKTVGKLRFSDIYFYRGRRWLAVTGQETLLPESAK